MYAHFFPTREAEVARRTHTHGRDECIENSSDEPHHTIITIEQFGRVERRDLSRTFTRLTLQVRHPYLDLPREVLIRLDLDSAVSS